MQYALLELVSADPTSSGLFTYSRHLPSSVGKPRWSRPRAPADQHPHLSWGMRSQLKQNHTCVTIPRCTVQYVLRHI